MQKEALTEETGDYLITLLQKYEATEGGLPPDAIPAPIPVPREEMGPPSAAKFLVPSVILWDPLTQVPNVSEIPCPHEIHDFEVCILRTHSSSKNNFGRWKAARGTQDVPRALYCCDGITLLVSRMYTCKRGHKIISHDPRILEHVPSSYQVPFSLLHRTGFTRELTDWVQSCVFAGMTFHEIEEVLIQRHQDSYEERKCKFRAEVKLYLEKHPDVDASQVDTFPPFNMSQLPSLETIMASIVQAFDGNEQFYIQRMSEWPAKIITAGYFFKVSTTIGEKLGNGKWCTHFKNIYTVTNEKGQVIAWKFTKEKDLNEVTDLLTGLASRFQRQGVQLEMILVPDCCESKELFTGIFGANIPVKLDLSKAVHRIVRKTPVKKREENQLTRACIRDFALSLRFATDRGDVRHEETPPEAIMLENIQAFVNGWKDIMESTERVLTLAAQRQITQLIIHVEQGCLSAIPAATGSENTGELHSILKPVLERKFLNADMALALISTLLYVWNERKANQLPKGALVRPISKYRGSLEVSGFVPSSERFGIIKSEEGEGSDISPTANYSFDVLALQCLILEALAGKKMEGKEQGESESGLGNFALKKIISRASNLFSVLQLLKTQALVDISFSPRLIHLMACSLILFSRNECAIDDRSSHEKRLNDILQSYQLMVMPEKKETTEADGFFTAVTSGLNSILRSDLPETESVKKHLNSIGYYTDEAGFEENVSVLRQLISDEWLSCEEEYSKLLVSQMISFTDEAQAFRKRGYFKAEMSNLLPIAAAKVLRVPVIVFTSLQHFPVVPVVPTDAIIIGTCVHVAYNAAGFGSFYDVGIYTSSAIVLPKVMTDPKVRRRDSRKRYREKQAQLKGAQPPKKRGRKPKLVETASGTADAPVDAVQQESTTASTITDGNGEDATVSKEDIPSDEPSPNKDSSKDVLKDDSQQDVQPDTTAGDDSTILEDSSFDMSKDECQQDNQYAELNETTATLGTDASDSSFNDLTEQDTSMDLSKDDLQQDLQSNVNKVTESTTASEMKAVGSDVIEQESSMDLIQKEAGKVEREAQQGEGYIEEPLLDMLPCNADVKSADQEIMTEVNLIELACTAAGMVESSGNEDRVTQETGTAPIQESTTEDGILQRVEPGPAELQGREESGLGDLISHVDFPEPGSGEGNVGAVAGDSVQGNSSEMSTLQVEEGEEGDKVDSAVDSSPAGTDGKPGASNNGVVVMIQEGVAAPKKTYCCSCGRGSGKNPKRVQFCLTLEGGYLTRCICFRNATGCSRKCRCYLCSNPYGTAQAAKAVHPPRLVRRFRPRHKVQVIKSRYPGLTLAPSSVKTEAQTSKWPEVESMAFECLIAAMSHAGLELSPEIILKEYNALQVLQQDEGGFLGNSLQTKTLDEVSQQFDTVQKNIHTFENLYKKQTELNWFQGMEVVFSTEVVVSS